LLFTATTDKIRTTENTKISIDISNVLNVEKYKDAEIYFAVLPEADAGNYQKNLYFLDMENDVTKDVNIYTFEAPCKNPIIAVYGKVGDLVYRFKDLRVSVDTNATITTPTPTEVCLNNLQVVGAEEIKFSKETKNYEVSLYQYQRNVQVLAEAQTGLTITVDGKPVESGEYSQRIEVSTEEAKTIEVVVSGNSTEETYTLTLKRPEYPDIIITEVMTDGYQYRLGLDKYELIEIYNASGEDIDLRDYSIGYKKDYPNSSLNNGEMLEKWPYYFTGNDTAFQSTSKANATYTGINKITKYSSYWDNGEVDTDAPIPFPADSTMVIWVKYTRQEGDEELVASWNYDTLMTALEDSAFAEEQKTLTVDIDGNKTAVIPKQEQLVVAEVPYGTIGGSQTSRAGKTSEEAQQNFLLEGHGAANEGSQTRSWLFLLKPGAEQAKNGAITETGNDIISASKFVRVATTVNNCSSTDKLSSVFQYDLDRGMSLVKDETYWNSETIGQGHTSDQQGYGNLTSFGAIEYWQKPIDFSDEETPSVIATKSEGENNKGIVTFEVEDDTDIRYVEFYARKKGAEEWSSVLKKDLVLLDGLEADRTLSNQDIYKFTWEFELEEGSDNEVEYYGYLVDGSGKKHELGYQTGTSDSCKIQTELYTKDEVETFRTAGDYPKDQEGYIFAGWYEDDAYQNPLLKTETVPETGAYAKFVPDHILSVKTQVSANLLDGNVDNDATGSIRFVTSVDSLKYNKMGFKVQIQGYDAQLIESNIVDEVLYGVDEQGNDTVELKYKPQTTFCSQSTYFKSLAFYGIPKADFDTKITVTPYWITKDGTTVFGSTVVRTVNQVRTVDWVYVSNEGADSNNGTKTAPYRTLSHALEQVENYGTICFMTDYTEDSTFVWEDHNKDVTIRGYDGNEVKEILDISVVDNDASSTGYQFNINDAVTFADIILKVDATANNTYIYANGNRFKIGEDVIVDGIPRIYGAGAPGTTINSDTNVTLLAGNYKIIYGGGNNCTLNGNTKLYIAGNVNTDADKIDFTKSNAVQIYGGGYKGTVRGNTEVYVAGNVNGGLEFNTAGGERVLLYGAGSSSTVTGSTYVTVEGNAKFTRIYGGGFQGTVMKSAHVSIAGDVNAGVTLTTRDAYNANLYGGSNAGTIGENTIVNVKGNARFTRIYGGGYQNTSEVTGSTNVTVSGNVNSGVDVTNHGHLAALYGGSHQGKVGSSNVTILENARFSFIYGGGHGATDKVSETGSSNVVFGEANAIDSDTQGVKAYGVYGGSREGANGSTKVVVNSGVVAQIFGGSYLYSVTDETSATTDVQLLGGEITRRVYGGCYNECKNYSSSDWIPDYEWVADREGIPLYSVNGYTNVTISNNVKFSWSETDQGVFAGSRYKETFNDETGTIIFVDGAYSTKKGALGRQDSETNLLLGDLQAYNYLVDASAGGKVTAQGSTLQIVPNSANATVSVSDIDSSNLTNNENGTYTLTLPAIGKDDQKTITVKFN